MAAGNAPVFWADGLTEPFSVPFFVSAHSQRLWIAADLDGVERELQIKGTNWVCKAQPVSACCLTARCSRSPTSLVWCAVVGGLPG